MMLPTKTCSALKMIPKKLKHKRIKRKDRNSLRHLAWVATHPCCVCGRSEIAVHHLIHYKPSDKIGRRDDKYVIPICRDSHDLARGVHGPEAEIGFLESRGVNGLEYALELFEKSPYKDELS